MSHLRPHWVVKSLLLILVLRVEMALVCLHVLEMLLAVIELIGLAVVRQVYRTLVMALLLGMATMVRMIFGLGFLSAVD